jgi:hypothetical protein
MNALIINSSLSIESFIPIPSWKISFLIEVGFCGETA